MKLGFLKECQDGENRVIMTPENTAKLLKTGFEIWVEKGAGEKSFFSDNSFADAGGKLVDRNELLSTVDWIFSIHPPNDLNDFKEDSNLVSIPFFNQEGEFFEASKKKKLNYFSLARIPRISMAQKMDVLSSQANIAGYKAVLIAATKLSKYMPLLMTAAGTIQPAKVLVIGAGVAGLQAIATAKRLGASVTGTDIRPEVKEQVESLGASYLIMPAPQKAGSGGYAAEQSEEELKKQQEVLENALSKSDVIITTASIPGRKAPVLVKKHVLDKMPKGAVIIDLAAPSGGNCELTKVDEEVNYNGVTIVGPGLLPAHTPIHASEVLSRNVLEYVSHIKKSVEEKNWDEEIYKSTKLWGN